MFKYSIACLYCLVLLFSVELSAHDSQTPPADKGESSWMFDRSSFMNAYKKVKYETSLAYTKYSSGEAWWSLITPFNLFLGAIPLKNQGHLEEITNLGVTSILSVVENFELEDGWFNVPVKVEDWKERGITVLQIEAADFYPLQQAEIEQGINHLADMLDSGETVYVHCKAGRGRSASIVIAYLMKFHAFSFEEAYQLVYEQRPHINLNEQQRKAIFTYFNLELPPEVTYKEALVNYLYDIAYGINEMSEEKLSTVLQSVLAYVVNGVKSEEALPSSLSVWIPQADIQSTLQRRNRYLREYQGDQDAAVKAAIARNHSMARKLKKTLAGAIPFVGDSLSYSITLWHQLREITLIAALYGHDVDSSEVQMKILSCLVSGDSLKIPAYSVDLIARHIVKKILVKNGLQQLTGAVVPTHLIFNYFTENSAHVATYAIETFGKEKSLMISPEEYMSEEDMNQT